MKVINYYFNYTQPLDQLTQAILKYVPNVTSELILALLVTNNYLFIFDNE